MRRLEGSAGSNMSGGVKELLWCSGGATIAAGGAATLAGSLFPIPLELVVAGTLGLWVLMFSLMLFQSGLVEQMAVVTWAMSLMLMASYGRVLLVRRHGGEDYHGATLLSAGWVWISTLVFSFIRFKDR